MFKEDIISYTQRSLSDKRDSLSASKNESQNIEEIDNESVAEKLAKLDFDTVVSEYCSKDPETISNKQEYMETQNEIMFRIMTEYLGFSDQGVDTTDPKQMKDQDDFLDWWTSNISQKFKERYNKNF